MTVHGRLADLEPEERFPGVHVRTFESTRATVNRYEFEAGAEFPRHWHPQEQITLVEEGEITFALDDSARVLQTGDWQIVDPDVPHRVTAGQRGARVTALLVPRRGSTAVVLSD
jgi:quercetin dioxygenase-like cupin family protein